MKATKHPIPATIPALTPYGILSRSFCLIPDTVTRKNTSPAMMTATRVSCHVKCIWMTAVYTNIAFIPIPGAMATGYLAYRPMITDPMIAMTIVAVNAESSDMPASVIIFEFTTMMYDIAKNTSTPPFTSVLIVDPLDVIPK